MGRERALPVGLPYHAGGFPIEGVGGGVSYADVLELAREWRPVGNTLLRLSSFYGHYPQLASASVICTVVVYQI